MCVLNSCTCSKGNKCPVAYPTFPGSLTGNNGWSPLLSVVVDAVNLDPDGNDRDVLQLVGWFGGEGTTPTDYVGQYLGTTGFVPAIANGTNIRGARGAAGATPTGVWTNVAFGSIPIGATGITGVGVGGTFTVTSLTAGSLAYLEIGKTMFISFELVGVASVDLGGATEVRALFDLRMPNGRSAALAGGGGTIGYAHLQVYGANCEMAYPRLGLAGICHPLTYGSNTIHIDTGYITNTGGLPTTEFIVRGALAFEFQ